MTTDGTFPTWRHGSVTTDALTGRLTCDECGQYATTMASLGARDCVEPQCGNTHSLEVTCRRCEHLRDCDDIRHPVEHDRFCPFATDGPYPSDDPCPECAWAGDIRADERASAAQEFAYGTSILPDVYRAWLDYRASTAQPDARDVFAATLADYATTVLGLETLTDLIYADADARAARQARPVTKTPAGQAPPDDGGDDYGTTVAEYFGLVRITPDWNRYWGTPRFTMPLLQDELAQLAVGQFIVLVGDTFPDRLARVDEVTTDPPSATVTVLGDATA